jgi:hypothetical protein
LLAHLGFRAHNKRVEWVRGKVDLAARVETSNGRVSIFQTRRRGFQMIALVAPALFIAMMCGLALRSAGLLPAVVTAAAPR